MKVIHLMVSGPESEIPDLTTYKEDVIWVGVDRGAKRLLDLGIIPAVALGDFDSLTKEELNRVQESVSLVRQFPAEKDETDTEIGLSWALSQKPDLIRIFGATGGRIDHLFANLMMLMKPKFKAAIPLVEIIDCHNFIQMYLPGTYTVRKLASKKYVAFITMLPVTELTLKEFKYPLENANYPAGSALSSNEFNGNEGQFSFASGLILYIQSSD